MRRLSREAPVSTATKELTAHIVLGALLLGGSGQTAFNRVIHQVYCFPVPDSSPDIDCSDAAIWRGGAASDNFKPLLSFPLVLILGSVAMCP